MPTIYDVKARDIMTPFEKVLKVQKDERVSKAIGLMIDEGVHNIVVFDKSKYIGIFGHQQLIRVQNIPPELSKVEHFMFKPPRITSKITLVEIAEMMFKNNCRLLPVVEDGNLKGVVSERDVLKALLNLGELKGKRVADIMSSSPYCIKESDKLATAFSIMRDFRVSRLPVTDKNGKAVGLLESFDAIKRVVLKQTPESRQVYYGYMSAPGVVEELPVYRVPVRELMNNRPVLAKADDSLSEKIEEMRRLNESTVTVTNERGEPIGIIAPRDIVEWLTTFRKPTGLYMQISGWDPNLVGDFAEAQLHRMIEETAKKISSIVKIRNFAVHFKTYHETKDRVRFSLRARIFTDYGLFIAARHGYDMIAVANELFGDIERQVIEHERRHRDVIRERERRTKIIKHGDQKF